MNTQSVASQTVAPLIAGQSGVALDAGQSRMDSIRQSAQQMLDARQSGAVIAPATQSLGAQQNAVRSVTGNAQTLITSPAQVLAPRVNQSGISAIQGR